MDWWGGALKRDEQVDMHVGEQCADDACANDTGSRCRLLVYVAAKATYIRLLHAKIGILGGFRP